jgi:MFS superfamily sulfate permease-like transporter
LPDRKHPVPVFWFFFIKNHQTNGPVLTTKNKLMKKVLEKTPAEGFRGLIENFSFDAISGFIVFLLALPLSLGIAKASEFPPLMGLLTAIIGGMLVSFFSGSRLTIKGPAAGLIVIVVGAVSEFGGGDTGWHLALGAMVVAGIIQILFGLLRMGKLVDFFPLSAVHGMLAAIGIIIILKQFPVLLNVNPALSKGKSPFDLLASVPLFISNLDIRATGVGVVSFFIMMFWGSLKVDFLKKIPAPLIVLLVAIPAELAMDFNKTEPAYSLVHVGSLIESIRINVDFSGMFQTGIFIKYVVMFALVGSLESLLTVKAIDMLDPWQRKSDANKDLIAIGIGNTLSAVFGGLPMISEVARSSANVANGSHTWWGNFFHSAFLLAFVLLGAGLIELIPNSALAAMLITVGIRLAHPKEFIHIFQIGKEQLLIFLVTIFFTLFEDLLVGIAAGIVLKILIHLYNGASVRSLFSSRASVSFHDGTYLVEVEETAAFSNFLGLKSKLEAIPTGMRVIIDFSKTRLVDHSVLENLSFFEKRYTGQGGTVEIIGLEQHVPLSKHVFAARKKLRPLPSNLLKMWLDPCQSSGL